MLSCVEIKREDIGASLVIMWAQLYLIIIDAALQTRAGASPTFTFPIGSPDCEASYKTARRFVDLWVVSAAKEMTQLTGDSTYRLAGRHVIANRRPIRKMIKKTWKEYKKGLIEA